MSSSTTDAIIVPEQQISPSAQISNFPSKRSKENLTLIHLQLMAKYEFNQPIRRFLGRAWSLELIRTGSTVAMIPFQTIRSVAEDASTIPSGISRLLVPLRFLESVKRVCSQSFSPQSHILIGIMLSQAIVLLSVLASASAWSTPKDDCITFYVPVSIEAPQYKPLFPPFKNQYEATGFLLQGTGRTAPNASTAFSGPETVNKKFSINAQYCFPSGKGYGNGKSSNTVLLLTHGLGFDKR